MVERYFDDTIGDGRRATNPLTDPSNHTVRAPQVQLWKNAIADDAALAATGILTGVPKHAGINFADYQSAVIQIVPRNGALISSTPGGTSNPSFKLLEWNAGANAFVDTGVSLAAGGAGKSVSWSISALDRMLYIHITGVTAGQSVSIYSQGSNEEVR